MRGKFITFEGIDGAGKSSHIKAAADLLASKGIEVITTRSRAERLSAKSSVRSCSLRKWTSRRKRC